MPEISRFFGMIITMYFSDHQPPHFHVRYADFKAQVSIDSISILRGNYRLAFWSCSSMGIGSPRRIAGQLEIGTKRDSSK